MLRKTLCCLLCCISIMCLAATAVFAAASVPDATQAGSISFDFSGAEKPVKGGNLELRKVAYWDDALGTWCWCENYASAGVSLDDIGSEKAANQLYLYALVTNLSSFTIPVGKDGKATAEKLEPGVYLVSQSVPFAGFSYIKPALICVPCRMDDTWVYEVEAAPKLSPLTTEPTETTTEPYEELPPTGQTNWPIPVLVLVGSFLILLGICLRKDKKT